MKRKSSFMALAALALALFLVGSCGGSKVEIQPFETESLEAADSLDVKGAKAVVKIAGDYPVSGNPVAVDSVRTWIAGQLEYLKNFDFDRSAQALTAASMDSGKVLVANTIRALMERSRDDLTDLQESGFSMAGYDFDVAFKKLYQTDSLVTFNYSDYTYTGGAHGNSSSIGQTFQLRTGERLTNTNMFLPEKQAELVALIKQGLESYFQTEMSAEEKAKFSLADCLLIEPAQLTLPAQTPYFTKDGLVFVYQQYEIAPYAAGMPSCVIGYEQIKPFLTPLAASLIPVEENKQAQASK